MECTKLPSLIGISILSEMHEYFKEDGLDDMTHINQIALVVRGISRYLTQQGVSPAEIERVSTELKAYGKKLWVDWCVDAAHEEESEADVREESDEIFEYVFEHGEYPY
jgi:hypothetical protein